MVLRKPVISFGCIKIRFLIMTMIVILMPECVSRQQSDHRRLGSHVTFKSYCMNLAMELLSTKVHQDNPIDQIEGGGLNKILFPSTEFLNYNNLGLQETSKSKQFILKACTSFADLSIAINLVVLLYCLIHLIRLHLGIQYFIDAVCFIYGKTENSKIHRPKSECFNLKAMLNDFIHPERKKSKYSSILERLTASDEKYAALQKSVRGKVYTVMTFFQNDMQRIASYSGNQNLLIPDSVSVLLLARAGFYYPGVGTCVTCNSCNNEVQLNMFYSGDSMNDPTNSRFHAPGCRFVSHEDDLLNPIKPGLLTLNGSENFSDKKRIEVPVKFPTEKVSVGAAQYIACYPHVPDNLEIDGVGGGDAFGASSFSTCPETGSPIPQRKEDDNLGSTSQRDTNISFSADDVQPRTQTKAAHEASSAAASESRNGATSCHYGSSDWLDEALCVPEQGILKPNDPNNSNNIYQSTCSKNSGHYGYFLLDKLRPEQLPAAARCKEFIQFIQLFGHLTVRVKVVQSSDRKGSESPKDQDFKVGTGWVSLSQSTGNQTSEEGVEQRKVNTLRKYLATLVKKEKHMIFIEVNRHVVTGDEEALDTTVEFFLDYPNSRGVKTLKGVQVIHSDLAGDNQSILVCKTSDGAFVQQINKIRHDLLQMVERLPKRTKESMMKKLYIIGHPHGKEKVLSFGDSVPVKYAISSGEQNGHELKIEKINNAQEVRTSPGNIRKSILYAADTCNGSSGAPVIGFIKILSPVTGQDELQMNVWMHNGAEKDHSLGMSVLKACTEEDLQRYMSAGNHQPSGVPDDNQESEEEPSPENQEVSSPVFKVLSHPSYPTYIAYAKRLESLQNGWQFGEIHTAEELADAGFFYAGYADCIRCFQCGLGLRSWKPGDNIYTEHEKHRPNCPFLQAQMNNGSVKREASQRSLVPLTQQPTNDLRTVAPLNELNKISAQVSDQVRLLTRENTILQQQLRCKVCIKAPIRDLFLPCGELYACSECSKLLTHCPSCNKQILATVTTYFA